ncbi:thiamine-phosphate pyrophosphorylase [Larkinella arboricola]|uniref:Thiamine-phosphate synthase n=1 Tax=Larkinella arboricola TaxID=643671 RepID=A0A327WU34_LARAB|nr:thiamine phosphate synthase [Larkinella arboricola]RAJ92260.1 thiamine-phosphate pyrophosphorylase [Larkinella arboricola]
MKISQLHYITASPEQAEAACRAGVDWVQLRVKNRNTADWKALALETLAVCRQYNARLIINDNVTLAAELGADGVHVGKEDLPVAEARRRLGDSVIIGGTANTLDDIRAHHAAGADYIGLGPYRFTTTKEKLSPILGLEGYRHLLTTCSSEGISLPIIAIGGIEVDDVPALLREGVHGIAVSGAITREPASQVPAFWQAIQTATSFSILENR